MKKYIIILASITGIILIFTFIMMGKENSAILMDKNCEKALSNVKIEEKRRFDLIPNLVECVKQYDEHEYKTLRDVIAARSGNVDVDEVKMMIQAVAEAYPELKSQKNYQDLMNELSNTENKIAQYRELYNTEVIRYQIFTEKFPNKQILSLVGYQVKPHKTLEFRNSSEDAPELKKLW